MRILKISICLLLLITFVGCNKSDLKPTCPADKSAGDVAAPENKNAATAGKIVALPLPEDKGTVIVGSGDDDRDGGDKKHNKKTR